MASYDLVRAIVALVRSGNEPVRAHAFASQRWGEQSAAARLVRGVIDTGSLGDTPDSPAFAAAYADLVSTARTGSLLTTIDRLSPWRRLKPNAPALVTTQAAKAHWTPQGQEITVDAEAFASVRLGPLEIGSIIIGTHEAFAEMGEVFVRQLSADLADAVGALESQTLTDPANAGEDGVTPASLTYAATQIASTGATPEAIRSDMAALFSGFSGDLARSVLAMNPATATGLALMGASIGAEGVTALGGNWLGLPAVTNRGVSAGVVALIDASGVVLVDEGARIDTANQAHVNVRNSDDTTDTLLLWQQNLTGLRIVRVANWQAARPDCVRCLTGLTFAPPIDQ